MFLAIILRDLRLTFNNISQFFNPIIFFFIAISIFAIATSNSNFHQEIDYQISVIWFCLVFAVIIGIGNFLKDDYMDGSLEQILHDSYNFELFVVIKIISNWLIYCLPLIMFIPIAAIILKIESHLITNIITLAILISLIVNLVGCFCASLTICANKNEALLSILILPLIIPLFLFANSAFIDADYVNYKNSILFLTLLLIFLAPILILFTSFALKISVKG